MPALDQRGPGRRCLWQGDPLGVREAGSLPGPGRTGPRGPRGAPPAVDVYINDGRHGEYQHQPVHWHCQNVWNRRYADTGTIHEDPWLDC